MKNVTMPMIVILILVLAGIWLAWQGVSMHNQVGVEEAEFHELQTSYFTQSKLVRDSADTGSALSAQLAEIQNFPSELLRLKLVGIGKILEGIFILLFAILMALVMMPVRLAKIIRENR